MNKRRRYKAKRRRGLARGPIGPATYRYWVSQVFHRNTVITADKIDKAISDAFRRCT